ncbi:MAG TPA: hypothetical protein VMW34_11500 [Anaerolineales bacterium]|nr:hypothetical protein [Anaerolineales bacterium]
MKLSMKLFAFLVIFLAMITMSLGVALSAGTPVVSPGSDATAVHLGSLRYRELATGNDAEVFLGVPDLGDGTRRTQTDLTWGTSNTITFTFDPVLDKLTTTVDNGTTDWVLDYQNYSSNVRNLVYAGNQAAADEALSKLNYMQINVRLGEGTPAQLSLDDVYLDGNLLGDFAGVIHETIVWQVNDYDLNSGFTLTGVLNLTNITSPSGELNKVDINFGYVNTDIFPPTISNVAAAPNPQSAGGNITLTATIDDTGNGGSIILSADYRLDAGAWTPMSASDGTFNSPTENVTADLDAPATDGPYTLCVRGTDSANNTSSEQCTTLEVDSVGPLTSAVAVDPQKIGTGVSVDLTAAVDDSTTGGSDIQSAEYSLNGVDWTAMAAQDSNFDSAIEIVVASFPSPNSHGDVNVCVRGTDAAVNTGAQSCTTLTVDSLGPLTSAVLLDPNPVDPFALVTISAGVDDTTSGNSNISSAEYQVAGGAWIPVAAQDSIFDSPSEAVTAQFAAPQSSVPIEICVRGRDTYGNTGSSYCGSLEVTGSPTAPPPLYLPILVSNYTNP